MLSFLSINQNLGFSLCAPKSVYQSQKKPVLPSGLRTYFFENLMEILGFLLYPWRFQKKQGFTPRNFTKVCYSPQKF